MTPESRREMGLKGRAHTQREFNFDDFIKRWDDLFMKIHNEHGSWEDRTGYTPYEVRTF